VADDQTAKTPSGEDAAAQLSSIKVADLVVQATAGLISLGFVRTTTEQRDLAQARLAIDCLRALEPVLRDQVSAELASDLANAVAGLQVAFVNAASESKESKPQPDSETAEPVPAEPPAAENETDD